MLPTAVRRIDDVVLTLAGVVRDCALVVVKRRC
jgi:hypothetical protein